MAWRASGRIGSRAPYSVAGSDEGKRQETRTQKRDARRRQGKEAVGNKVVILHDTLRSRCWSEFVKIFGTSHFERSDTCAARLKSASGSPQMHEPGKSRRRPNPSLLSSSRTFQNVLCDPARRRRRRPCTVKKIQARARTIAPDRGFRATGVSKLGSERLQWPVDLRNH